MADRGVAELLAGEPADAVTWLERAVAGSPGDARWWSNLAAAHLAFPQDPQHLLSALTAANRAVDLAPIQREALFNRALSLQRLCLLSEARTAWERYLQNEDDPAWIAEAEARRAELARPSEVERWKPALEALKAAALRGNQKAVETVVSEFPQRVRLYAEEDLLAEWADAVRSERHEAAAQALATAGAIGRALAGFSGDRLLLESVEAIERSNGPELDRLASGHASYRLGLDRLHVQTEEAGSPLAAARQELEAAGSPFALWARFALAHRDYLMTETERALTRFAQIRRIAGERSYKSLGGRASWLMGTCLLFQARPSEALAALRRSLELLGETRESNHIAGVHLLLARTLDFLGDSRGAWSHRFAALQGAVQAGDAGRLRIVFADTAWDLPDPKIALSFQAEAVRAARKLADPGHLATALRQRAAVRHRLKDHAGALRDLRDAQTQAARLTSETARATTFYELRLTEAEIRRERDPAGALAAAEAALALGKDRYFIPPLLVERARAHLALGDSLAAERDVDAAVAEIEAQRGGIDEALRRASYLDRAREAFERAVDLRLANGRGYEAALDAAEKIRSRVLFEWIANLPPGVTGRKAALRSPVRLRPVAGLRRELPAEMVAVEYLVRDDRTLAWVFGARGIEMEIVPAGTADLERRWEAWRQALGGRDGEAERQAAADLHRLLIAPLARHFSPGDALVLIPDKTLHSVPFAALLDAATGRRLIQDRTLFFAPSANVLAVCLQRARTLRSTAAPGALIVADPSFDRTLLGHLSSLPAARREGQAISSLYSPALLLSDAEATKSRFLAEAGRHGVVHFVGHALRNRDNPLLSALVVAADPAAAGASLLYAHELLGRRLDRTRLVVLAACSTGLGAPSPTEGALSLAAPFLAAGVPAVVATLWDVSDAASAPLMASFHRHLRQGEDAATALRSAQLEMLAGGDRALAAPRAWAAFELIGAR